MNYRKEVNRLLEDIKIRMTKNIVKVVCCENYNHKKIQSESMREKISHDKYKVKFN